MVAKKKSAKKLTTTQRLDETIYDMAKALYDIDGIDSITMRNFEAHRVPEVEDLSPKDIKRIRLKAKVSQSVFAKFLNTSVESVRQWEQGRKHPRGTSLKLLNLVAQKGLAVLG